MPKTATQGRSKRAAPILFVSSLLTFPIRRQRSSVGSSLDLPMQHFLYFLPLPHGQGALRPVDIIKVPYIRIESQCPGCPRIESRLYADLFQRFPVRPRLILPSAKESIRIGLIPTIPYHLVSSHPHKQEMLHSTFTMPNINNQVVNPANTRPDSNFL